MGANIFVGNLDPEVSRSPRELLLRRPASWRTVCRDDRPQYPTDLSLSAEITKRNLPTDFLSQRIGLDDALVSFGVWSICDCTV